MKRLNFFLRTGAVIALALGTSVSSATPAAAQAVLLCNGLVPNVLGGPGPDTLYGGGRFIPNVYIIDQAGIIRWQRVGSMEIGGAEVIKAEVDRLLVSPKTGGT